ncbi:DgyrCDS14632 [Dimorphilus gyrociliatus]|uniref:non-specific serine/threonine protein kinase n=1 Tax=Dimorphilus gyrociliatus TaxID=2664684 RepID=A0A7I8WEM7_9ANNE|nr:DgyrCDS14632 [Dimorphilus gyrociliatus]
MSDKQREDIQLALANIIKSPVLNDQLLRNLPYQYVKDILISVLKATDLKDILTDDDLKFKIDTFDQKIQLLEKIIKAVGKELHESNFVDANDIVSGKNVNKTLQFLLMLTRLNRITEDEKSELKLGSEQPIEVEIGSNIENKHIVQRNNMPLKLLFSKSLENPVYKVTENKKTFQINSITLEDVDFLNDYFFCLIFQIKGIIKEFDELPWIPHSSKITNCKNITDWAVFWTSKSEKQTFLNKSKTLRAVNTFAGCNSLSTWNNENSAKTQIASDGSYWNDKKAVIIHFHSLYKDKEQKGSYDRIFQRINFESLMINQKIEYCTNVLNYWKVKNWTFYDCYEDYVHLLSPKQSLFIIPFNLTCNEENLSKYFMDVIIGLLQMNLCPNTLPVVIFIGFGTKINEIAAKYALITMIESLIEDFHDAIRKRSSIEELSKIKFNDQNNIHNLVALTELLKELKENLEDNNSHIISFLNYDNQKDLKDLVENMKISFQNVTHRKQKFKYSDDIIDKSIAKIEKILDEKEDFLTVTQLMKEINIEDLLALDIDDKKEKCYAEKICQFPFFDVFQLCYTLGHIVLLRSFACEEWFVANPKWFTNLIQKLHNISEECNDRVEDDLFFFRKKTKVCQIAEWYCSTFKFQSDIFEVFFGAELSLTLSSTTLFFPIQLSTCEKDMMKLMKKENMDTTISDLYHNWITLQYGPVEAFICFDDAECKTIKVCCRVFENDNSPILLANIAKEIETIIDYSLKISSVYFSKTMKTPWGDELDKMKKDDDDRYSTLNLKFFNNFYLSFDHEIQRHFSVSCSNKCILRREHFLWKMHKEIYPTFKREMIVKDDKNEFTTIKERDLSDNSAFDFIMDLINFYSITLINCQNLKFELIDSFRGYSIMFNSQENTVKRIRKDKEDKLVDFSLNEYSIVTVKLLPQHGEYKSYNMAFSRKEICLNIYLNDISILMLPLESQSKVIFKFHEADSNLIFDFTYAPRQEFNFSHDSIDIGQKLFHSFSGDIATVEAILPTEKLILVSRINKSLSQDVKSIEYIKLSLKNVEEVKRFFAQYSNDDDNDQHKISEEFLGYLNAYNCQSVPNHWIKSLMSANNEDDIPLPDRKGLLKECVQTKLGTVSNPDSGRFLCYFHNKNLKTTNKERDKFLDLISEDKIQTVENDILKFDYCQHFKLLTKWYITNDEYNIDGREGGEDELFGRVKKLNRLKSIALKNCNISTFATNIDRLSSSLENLHIMNSPITTISPSIGKCSLVTNLHLNDLLLTDLPMEMSNLFHLKFLNLGGNLFKSVPRVINQLNCLKFLLLPAINFKPFHLNINQSSIVTIDEWKNVYTTQYSRLSHIGFDETNMLKIFKDAATATSSDTLTTTDQIEDLHATLYKTLPRISSWSVLNNISKQSYKTLTFLDLKYQSFKILDDSIGYLEKLESLHLSFNLLLEEISPKIADLPLNQILFYNCPSLRTPPKVMARSSAKYIKNYMRALSKGFVSCKRTKLMLVGLGGAGKTSLVNALTESNQEKSEKIVKNTQITDGICIKKWFINSIEYSIWDFAGQTVYYNTHQFFLSNRAVYFLVWNVRSGEEHAGLEFWLNSIKCHAPKAPIFIVGTHIDQGFKELVDALLEITSKEKYMNEKIPSLWLDFEEALFKESKTLNIISIDKAMDKAFHCGIVEKAEFYQAVEFLHQLGSVLYFQNEYLRKKIIINPQWIVDVMACIVSVHINPIKNGKLLHDDLSKIWPEETYSKDLHQWLLRLTEEFDLTFCLKNEMASLVPCLLPDVEPDDFWEEEPLKENEVQSKMMLNFDYLPFGLFNRAQVRLYQFGDESLIWKSGSFLRKNGHRGILKKTSLSSILMEVRGLKPENVLFLVHEVFETLIAESFEGVQFDFKVPCPECIYQNLPDPSMVKAVRIRRALQLKIPFMQCTRNFHTVSITQLQNMLPPESSEELDMHLQSAVTELKKIQPGPLTNVVMLYCLSDDPPSELDNNSYVSATKIKNELEKSNFSIKMYNDSCESYFEEAIASLKSTQVVLTLMTDDFVKNTTCRNLFIYVKKNLVKQNQLILIKKSDKWKKHTDVGMLCSDDLYINMQNIENFNSKMNDLKNSLNINSKSSTEWQPCFISYCWSNSQMAINRGTKLNEKALGKTDPRLLKEKLEEAGIKCWMDIEQVNRGGLFQDIAEGLKKAKIVVACVSDEYVSSKNCQMEFRFAAITLRLPIILAIVGTGKNWIKSEIGMISLQYPRVDLQERDTNVVEIVDFVKERLSTEKLDETIKSNKDTNHEEFAELLELAERKLLRQLTILQNLSRGSNFPHIPILDFSPNSDENSIMEYYFLFLCEHDQGWHLPDNHQVIKWNVPFKSEEAEKHLREWSAYLVRIYAILQYSHIQLHVLRSKEGQSFLEQLQTTLSKKSFRDSYVSLLESIANKMDHQYNTSLPTSLAKCQIYNGKILWLCNYHQKQPRVTILQSDETNFTKDSKTNKEEVLLEKIKGQNEHGIVKEETSQYLENKVLNKEEKKEEKLIKDDTDNSNKTAAKSQEEKEKKKVINDLISNGGRAKSIACVIC